MAELKTFTQQGVLEHVASNPDRYFIAIHGNVYDVTDFLDEHPGGEETLKEVQIKASKFRDATESFEDTGHSMDARDIMTKYEIGTIEGQKKADKKKTLERGEKQKSEGGLSSYLPVVLLLLAVLLGYYYSQL